MGSKHASTSSTGLTPGMKGVRVGGKKSPDDSNKENIPPGTRKSTRNTPANRALFPKKEEDEKMERRSTSRHRRAVSPQKNRSASPQKSTPRKRTASATGDKLREEASSPSKKESPGRPRRNASEVAKVNIRNQSDAITPTQPTTRKQTRGAVLELDNVDVDKPQSPPRAKKQQQKQQPRHTAQQRKAWRGIGDSDAEESEEEEAEKQYTSRPVRAAAAAATATRRSTRLGSVGRNEGGGDMVVDDLSPSKGLAGLAALSMTTPRKRDARTPPRTNPPRGTPGRSTVANEVEQERESRAQRTPTRAAAAAKKMTYTPIKAVTAPMARLPTLKLKKVSTGAGEESWAKKTGKTPRTEGRPPPRLARIARPEKDVSYEPEEVRMEESESEEEEADSSSESEAEEEEEEERTRRPSRGRAGPAAAGGGRSVSRGRAAAAAARPDIKKAKFRMEVEDDDGEPMAVDGPPSNLAAALDRLAVYRCPRGTLLCREHECGQIREFIKTAIAPNGISQACYISGVPGTGKTASVMAMVKELQSGRKCPAFVFIKVNAMYYTDPKQVFSEILYEYERKVRGVEENVRRLSGTAARKRLNALFECVDRDRPPVLMLVDELDQLSTKKQELIYDVFNWSSVEAARVSIISIANTLDLPERMLNQRICSRLGMNRIVFQPYTHAEIEQIVVAKLGGGGTATGAAAAAGGDRDDAIIDPSVIEIAARKVAAISGDLRKATDILRTAIEAAIRKGEQKLTFPQVQEAIRAASETLLVLAVRSLSRHEMILFDAAVDIVRTRDVVDFSMCELWEKYEAMARLVYDFDPINYHGVCRILLQLSSMGLVRATNPNERAIFRRRLRLVPAVHDATSAIKIVSARRAAEKSTTVTQP